ncbi:probable bifunctional dTTP/UTP pyrophosphatase/methyltransferase protein [Uloborus diversus]|uniref:probable bifunctional dTTP/UTP pyrophosphatase/methyltransferase protein n=1 Tax=Uloborus diversus TaxID=327109 RepID=UPI002409D8EB|nr:probable bifunctional dTTP/UTP pyrophosphatase/methyltransferase protein [Uloborus diversus]XP_054708849.1 probable bifunctional dTTP/UTP pyrophosphatase/methyltransferase protein [Uloborus diversus]
MLAPRAFEFLNSRKIILASSSPRRIEMLQKMRLKFDTYPHSFAEDLVPEDFETVEKFVLKTVDLKTFHVLKEYESKGMSKPDVIIAADTVVSIARSYERPMKQKLFGKPIDEEDAERILKSLSGRAHYVVTGVTINLPKESTPMEFRFCEETTVKMSVLDEETIKEYIKTGEPMDKAGAYAIQGLAGGFIESIQGDYSNVVGFPVYRFCKVMKDIITLFF